MARLFGMIGTAPLAMRPVANAFYSPEPFDGWGISGYSRGRAVYFAREAVSGPVARTAFDAAIAKVEKSDSPVALIHFRRASSEGPALGNTHPFHGRDWLFAHNGTLFNSEGLFLQDSQPQGTTDSERFMWWMLEHIYASTDPTGELVETLEENRHKIDFTALDFVLTDGRTLWAYHEVGKAAEPFRLHWAAAPRGCWVSSEILPGLDVAWKEFPVETLGVFKAQGAPEFISL